MPASIFKHDQSTLPDGRVVVSGGTTYAYNSGLVNTTYIYTSSKNEWATVATVPASFGWHRQSTLIDGRVLISGGTNGSDRNTAYIYNADNNIWDEVASIATTVQNHGQSILLDGRVLVSGGFATVSTAYLYNPGINIWSIASPMPAGFHGHGQSTLSNGETLVSGGAVAGGWGSPRNIVYTYDNNENRWDNVATLPISISAMAQSTLADGKVLVSGGYNGGMRNAVYIYTLDTGIGSWVSASPMTVGLYTHAQSTLADGRVLISGGTNTGSSGLSTAYIYTPAGWARKPAQANRLEGTKLIDKYFSLVYLSFFKRKVEGLPKSPIDFLGKRSTHQAVSLLHARAKAISGVWCDAGLPQAA